MIEHLKALLNRTAATAVAAALSAAVIPGAGHTANAADKYPVGPVNILVSYAAGGGTDRQARLLAAPLEKILGQPVTVQNLPGGGGQVAAKALLRGEADGYTILATNQPDLNMTVALKGASYAAEDFQAIMVDLFDPRILLVRKDSPIRTFGDFVAKAKADPGGLTVSISQGGAQEQFAKWLFGALEIDVRLVGYKGGSRAANAMVGGQVDATMGDDSARFNIREQAHALLLGAPKRSPRWPEAEPMTEALKPFGVTPPTDYFLARYGVYLVPSAFKKNHSDRYAKLQKAIVEARQGKAFGDLLAKRKIEDLSIGKPGEGFTDAFRKSVEVLQSMTK
ncbi:MAG: tripartite tricarboxylate transporter substrate binding protein [Minwuiales bacterium]|nr:tripartite tricarboxylate transporter substrate binding protein [Minwuiales bacterium]